MLKASWGLIKNQINVAVPVPSSLSDCPYRCRGRRNPALLQNHTHHEILFWLGQAQSSDHNSQETNKRSNTYLYYWKRRKNMKSVTPEMCDHESVFLGFVSFFWTSMNIRGVMSWKIWAWDLVSEVGVLDRHFNAVPIVVIWSENKPFTRTTSCREPGVTTTQGDFVWLRENCLACTLYIFDFEFCERHNFLLWVLSLLIHA